MADWTLIGTGPKTTDDWGLLVTELAGWHAGWADLQGFHLEEVPTTMPSATHLWAWTTDSWVRVRLDGPMWTASALFRGTPPASVLWAENREPVAEVTCSKILSWSGDGRVKQLVLAGTARMPTEMWQLTPVRGDTAVFVGTIDTLARP